MTDSLSAPATYLPVQRAVLTSIVLGSMLVPLNSTMIAVALPDIMHAFGVTVSTASWLVERVVRTPKKR